MPLESLHDSFAQEELRDSDRRVREAVGDVEYVAEPKFDGLSVALEYRDGLFVRGSTRGDGVTGEDVTENIRTIRCVPKVLKEPVPFLAVRGEVYMSDESFARLCERQELLAVSYTHLDVYKRQVWEALLLVWTAGSLGLAAHTGFGAWKFHKKLRSYEPLEDSRIERLAQQGARELDVPAPLLIQTLRALSLIHIL